MLPGFRFLFAAIMLSMSLLMFGLGATALLRAAHEEFASNPSWRAAPEVMFARQTETTTPVLAMLHVDISATEKMQEDAPATTAPVEQAAIPSAPAEPERIAALKPEGAPPAETAKAEVPVTENPAPGEAMPALSEAPANETRVAAIAIGEVASPENQTVTTPSEPMAAPASPGADIAATKIATLGGPPVSIETPPQAKVSDAKPDESAIRKRQQAERAAQRRRLAAARARLAAQAAALPAYPFGQPSVPTTRAR
ncbi:hypothetical protein [Bradyrhizobium sp.]|uniref:hypothetical protein n=1 Tax=Bradyrhizobium sp. TaxID=376 RepID=UPI003C78E000